MKYVSVFDIIGPVMVGPSSSHTAGAVRIGQIAWAIYGGIAPEVKITFYGSFAHTWRGHGTGLAVVAGLLGFKTYDERISQAFTEAQKLGMHVTICTSEEEMSHPNTARIELSNPEKGFKVELVGASVGGGSVEIVELNGYKILLDGDAKNIIIMHNDVSGSIAMITSVFAKYKLNISHMEVSRKVKRGIAIMLVETDEDYSLNMIQDLEKLPIVTQVIHMKKIGSQEN